MGSMQRHLFFFFYPQFLAPHLSSGTYEVAINFFPPPPSSQFLSLHFSPHLLSQEASFPMLSYKVLMGFSVGQWITNNAGYHCEKSGRAAVAKKLLHRCYLKDTQNTMHATFRDAHWSSLLGITVKFQTTHKRSEGNPATVFLSKANPLLFITILLFTQSPSSSSSVKHRALLA